VWPFSFSFYTSNLAVSSIVCTNGECFSHLTQQNRVRTHVAYCTCAEQFLLFAYRLHNIKNVKIPLPNWCSSWLYDLAIRVTCLVILMCVVYLAYIFEFSKVSFQKTTLLNYTIKSQIILNTCRSYQILLYLKRYFIAWTLISVGCRLDDLLSRSIRNFLIAIPNMFFLFIYCCLFIAVFGIVYVRQKINNLKSTVY